MKKWIAIIAAVATFAVLTTGCGSSVEQAQAKAVSAAEKEDENETRSEEELHMLDDSNLGKSGLKIALITSPDGTEDHAVNEGLKQGLDEFLESDQTASYKEFVVESGEPDDCLSKVKELAGNYQVIVACGEKFSGISEIAKEKEDVWFILFDAQPLGQDGKVQEPDNVTSFTYKDEECGFLAGVTAALETKTGKVAAVSAKDSKIGANGKLGFACGVNYSNKHFGTSANVIDPGEEETAEKLIAVGCDILYAAAPECAAGIMEAAKAAEDVRVIGSFIDQFPYGGDAKNNVVVTSVYRTQNLDLMSELVTVAMDNKEAENKALGANEFGINYYFDTDRSILSDKSRVELEKVYELLRKGKIVPASEANGMTADKFTGL